MEDRLEDSREKRDHDKLPDHCVCLFISTFLFLPSFLHIDSLSLMLFHDWTQLTGDGQPLDQSFSSANKSLSLPLSVCCLSDLKASSIVPKEEPEKTNNLYPGYHQLQQPKGAQRNLKEPTGDVSYRIVWQIQDQDRRAFVVEKMDGNEEKRWRKTKRKQRPIKKRRWNIDREQTLHC